VGWVTSQLLRAARGHAEPSQRLLLRRPWWVWGCVGAALIIAAFGWSGHAAVFGPGPTAFLWLTVAVIISAGVIAAGSPTQRANGRLMLLIGLALSTNALYSRPEGLWIFVADVLNPFPALLLYVLLLRWPRSRLQTASQLWLVRLALVGVPLLTLVDMMCYDPAWDGQPDLWWPSVVPSRDFCYAITTVTAGYILVLLAVFLVVLPARVRWASRPERRELVPVVIAALALSAAETYVWVRLLIEPTAVFDVSLLFYLAFATVPLSFLVAMLVRRVQRALAVESLLRPERLPTPESVHQALAKAMGDDRLGLALYSPDQGGYVDVHGAPAGPAPPDRFAVHVPAADGTPIARVDLHPRLEGRPELTSSVLQAAAVALDHARLEADLRAQRREVELSQVRLDEANLEHAIRSGHRARALLAYEEAAAHFGQALEMLDTTGSAPPARRCELLLALAETQMAAADMPAARTSFEQAAEVARSTDDAELLAKAALGLGAEFRVGAVDQLQIHALQEALDALDTSDSALRARVLARLACALLGTSEVDRRIQLSEQAMAMARRVGDPAGLATVLSDWHLAIWGVEGPERRLAVADEIIRLGEASGDQTLALQGHALRSGDLLELGDVAGMAGEVEAVAQAANQLRQLQYQWQIPLMRATLAHLEGRFDQAEQLAEEALAAGRRAEGHGAVPGYLGVLATVRSSSGRRLEELIGPLREAADRYPTIPAFRAALAMLLAGVDRREEANDHFERLAADGFAGVPRDHLRVLCLACLAAACCEVGDRERAAQLYELLLPSASHVIRMARVGAGCLGAVAHQLGMLAATMGRWEDAVAHLEAAIATQARMGAPPLLAISHYHLARALEARRRPGDSQQASQHHAEAVTLLRRLDMRPLFLPGLVATQPAPQKAEPIGDARPGEEVAVLRREGEYWTVAWQDRTFRLRDMAGLGYLARLLQEPDRELHSLELAVPAAVGERASRAAHASTGSLGPMLDAHAKAAYRRRLQELAEEQEQAETWGDPERAARARAEIDALTEQLAAAVGLGGRDRSAASQAERARVNVTKAIRAAIRRIAEHDPGLGDHLRRSIRTGTFCAYAPDPTHPVAWRL
jgi:tetratricopeptide (TPR) repeat protein